MDVYLVGGAVRDSLLGRQVTERDWVVIGATPEEMLSSHFQQVGKDFPVFLHPETKEEYALARTERKTGHGYKGFTCYAEPNVTLEEDLQRRDLTINAIAQAADGTLVDPYDGQKDLEKKVLRHVSEAFAEDPLRVLRVARFAARYHEYGFQIAPETEILMKQMVNTGELEHLTPERIWKEFEKTFTENNAAVFVQTLLDIGALEVFCPELAQSWQQSTQERLNFAESRQFSATLRLASLFQDLGFDIQDGKSARLTAASEKLRMPKEVKDLAQFTALYTQFFQQKTPFTAEKVLKMLNSIDVWRKEERFDDVLKLCQITEKNIESLHTKMMKACYQAALTVNVQDVIKDGFEGVQIKKELEKRRISKINEALSESDALT